LFPALAYELAVRVPEIGNMIAGKVAKDPLVAINDNPRLPIRFIISSRPEKWIKDQFISTPHTGFRKVSLEETAETKEDIQKYLVHGFKQIYNKTRMQCAKCLGRGRQMTT
jgi:hypothetical protein